MAKRFTDTGKWKKPFIKGLSAKHKLLWFYILDDCDHAGVWEVDLEGAQLRLGEAFNYDEAFVALGQQIVPIGKFKWWIKDFISFQYGNLTPKNKMFEPVTSILKKYGIDLNNPPYIEHLSPIDGGKVKDKDKDKDKVEVKEEEKVKVTTDGFDRELKQAEEKIETIEVTIDEAQFIPKDNKLEIVAAIFTDEIYLENLAMVHRGKNIKQAFEECYLHFQARPSPPQEVWEWKQKLNTWLVNTKFNGSSKKGESGINARREGFAKRHSSNPGGQSV